MSLNFLSGLSRRDIPASPQVVQFITNQCTSPQPTIRATAQKYVARLGDPPLTNVLSSALRKLLSHVKFRTYSKTKEELWLEEWHNPIAEEVEITNPETFLKKLQLSGDVTETFVLLHPCLEVITEHLDQWILF